jgi:predicted RNA-binding protein with TRAM domain
MVGTDQMLCLFSAEVTRQNGSAVVEIPERELEVGDVQVGETVRVGLFETETTDGARADSEPRSRARQNQQEPPVEEGEIIDVEIEDLGEEGDGIARVGPGYVVFVSDTQIGERVSIELTSVRQNVAFGEVVERYDS